MAQLGRALRSGRRGRRFKSCRLDWHTWSVGQAVKTPPSHGGNRGSIPLRTTLRKNDGSCSFLVFSSGIEVVITGLTRNQFAGNRTGVRIPPAALQKAGKTKVLPLFLPLLHFTPEHCVRTASSLYGYVYLLSRSDHLQDGRQSPSAAFSRPVCNDRCDQLCRTESPDQAVKYP